MASVLIFRPKLLVVKIRLVFTILPLVNLPLSGKVSDISVGGGFGDKSFKQFNIRNFLNFVIMSFIEFEYQKTVSVRAWKT